MFCALERNGCGHFEDDGCPNWECEWSSLDAISEERYVGGCRIDHGGRRHDRLPDVCGQAVVTDVNLRYLATMTPAEARLMADNTHRAFGPNGDWDHARRDRWCARCRGHWQHCGHCAGAEAAVAGFVDRYVQGDRSLTEGLVHFWGNDIAGELRLFRGWCPHLPFDKRLATEEREWLLNYIGETGET
ncbi:MAG: hypothetical protein ACR2HN_12220 [Tepidiformaceae bacterium]